MNTHEDHDEFAAKVRFRDHDETMHITFDHDEIVAEFRWRDREPGWTAESCQHRSYEMVGKGLYFCHHCGKTVENVWRPAVEKGNVFVDLRDEDRRTVMLENQEVVDDETALGSRGEAPGSRGEAPDWDDDDDDEIDEDYDDDDDWLDDDDDDGDEDE